ncbi:MAG: AAA family ATPase [Planctomycetota bacterium]
MNATLETPIAEGGLLDSLLGDEVYSPSEPQSIEETGLSPVLIEGLVCKYLLQVGSSTGRGIADQIAVPFGVLDNLLAGLRARQIVFHQGQAQLNDYHYALTDQGAERARAAMEACAYVGPAPVPLEDYIVSVEAQSIRAEAAQKDQLADAFADINVEPQMLDVLGPAVNSGAGLFLYGAPGNGKTTVAKRITKCFGSHIWLPHTLIDDGQVIKIFDAACHEEVRDDADSLLKTSAGDPRWVKIRRPTVVVGGELTMDSLEIQHDAVTNISEASLQMKSNCGCLLIDDFGRQRIDPTDLLNRWIIPLENRHDFQVLASGKKVQVPFDQLIIFSTNLEPNDLADEAFLRRIPYKVEVADPTVDEFRKLFKYACDSVGCAFRPEAVDYLVHKHYRPVGRPLRRCQARDLIQQIANYCVYQGVTVELRPDYLDRAVAGYFTVCEAPGGSPVATPAAAAAPVDPQPPRHATTPVPQSPSRQDHALQGAETPIDRTLVTP